jgi:hypothetical protein
MRWIMVVIGVVLFLLGGLWLLQGMGVLAGSLMTGQTFWAIVGLVLLIVGAVLCVVGLRRKPTTPTT